MLPTDIAVHPGMYFDHPRGFHNAMILRLGFQARKSRKQNVITILKTRTSTSVQEKRTTRTFSRYLTQWVRNRSITRTKVNY